MTAQSVPALSFVTMGISLLVAILIPVGLFVFYRKKFGCKKMPFFVGCATFAIFALVLEGIFHTIILGGGRAEALMAKPILYGLYGGFMAGLFEETGRFLAFKTVLKKSRDDDYTSLMYGAGHGGFEAFYILLSGAVTNIVFSVLINSGNTELITKTVSGKALETMEQTFLTLQTANPMVYLAGIIERIPAVAIHISLSVLVWNAVKNKQKIFLYPIAIVLHMIVDAITASLALLKVNTVIVEIVIYVCAAVIILISRGVWKRERTCNQTQACEIKPEMERD